VARLQIRLGDQPIDVLVLGSQTVRQPVHEEAIRTGVRLWKQLTCCRWIAFFGRWISFLA